MVAAALPTTTAEAETAMADQRAAALVAAAVTVTAMVPPLVDRAATTDRLEEGTVIAETVIPAALPHAMTTAPP